MRAWRRPRGRPARRLTWRVRQRRVEVQVQCACEIGLSGGWSVQDRSNCPMVRCRTAYGFVMTRGPRPRLIAELRIPHLPARAAPVLLPYVWITQTGEAKLVSCALDAVASRKC